MRKLALDLSDLRVETFEVREAADGRGTVQAHSEGTDYAGPHCTRETIQCGSCEVSCNHTACPMDCQTVAPCGGPIYVTYEPKTCGYDWTCVYGC